MTSNTETPNAHADDNQQDDSLVDDKTLEVLLKTAGKRVKPEQSVADMIEQSTHQAWQMAVQEERRRKYRWVTSTSAAAVLLLGLMSVMIYPLMQTLSAQPLAHITSVQGDFFRNNHWSDQSAIIYKGDTLKTQEDGSVAFQLQDKTRITLDQNTQVAVVNPTFIKVISGRVYVDSPDHTTSIVVSTPLGDIVDIGTQYEVTVSPSQLNVAMREGVTKISLAAQTLYAKVENGLGEVITIDKDNNVAKGHIASSDEHWNWTRKSIADFTLQSTSIYELLAWASRVTGKDIVYASNDTQTLAEQTHLSGGSLNSESISDQLPELLKTTTLSIEERRSAFIVSAQQ